MNGGLLGFVVVVLAAPGLAYPGAAEARSHDGSVTRVGQNVYVPADQTIDGDLNVVFGDARVAGIITHDCNAMFGTCTVVENGEIRGRNNSVANEGMRAFLPWVVGKEYGIGALAEQDHRLFVKLAASLVVVLMFLLFPSRMRIALDRVEKHPALSAAVGAVAVVAIVPLAVLLAISIIGIPLIVLEIAGLFVGLWIGTGAIALIVGRRLSELVIPHATPSPLFALILGLVVVSSAEILPVVGWAVTALVWLIGLGCTILSFIRSAQLNAALPNTQIGGPPMRGGREF
ncbi:MAG: hypothetical protein NVS3B7_15590 [Candidatus Elarobacter sp.]